MVKDSNNAWEWDKPAEAIPESDHVDAGSIRTDRLRTREGTAIVGHATRESFIKATGRATLRVGLREPLPIPSDISAAEALAGLRGAYGVIPRATPVEDLRPEGRSRTARNREYTLATDTEIRAASSCADRGVDRSGSSGRYRQ